MKKKALKARVAELEAELTQARFERDGAKLRAAFIQRLLVEEKDRRLWGRLWGDRRFL